jgi:hypothetical protein
VCDGVLPSADAGIADATPVCAHVPTTRPCQAKPSEALQAFAEDVYHCSLEHGPQDAATSLGYHNLAKVLQSTGDLSGTGGCCYTRASLVER